ncbi:SWIM zinc finger family protein [Phycisphaera mikurensis]|uniref:SWIM-type domain-containing protein n=1 Tax=Phycisphaera mikurensis (strain NBRC 102666 / KCTC 22515 / FYK2301M01) TaxID=1142394 RepID=I0ID97_PHYMF|nr:hypothetical protein [Phycisphaera mikurensis]MBB6442360.1 putative Zn finger protein [Phycisphaera mikurensis]BAM03235.1 hypothetical protein PSMK_10760 [Phycisphaera mikurensis NBRC 102666]
MSWYDSGPSKPLGELKEEALELIAKPPKRWGAIRPVAAEGRQQTRTLLGTAFFEASLRYAGSASRATKAKGYLRHHCLVDLQVKDGDARATTAREGGGADGRVYGLETYETAFRLKPPPKRWWRNAVASLRAQLTPADASALAAGQLPAAVEAALSEPACPLLPQRRGVATSCDCLDGDSACKHLLCTMLGLAVLIDRDPLLLLRAHGLDPAALMPDLAEALPGEADTPADALDAATAADLFGF